MSNETVIASLKEKIDDLNHQAWEARVNDSPKAFELSSESVKLSREINYPKGLAEGLRSLGFCYVRLFKNDEAAPLLRESLSLFQSLNDLRGQAVIYEYLGIIERNWGNLGHSLELLLKGHELVLQVGPIDVEVTSSYQIGVTYKHLGNHENALDYLYQSLALAEKIDMKLMVAYSTNIIGSIYFDNGNYEKALELYQQGLVIRQQSKDKWGEAGSLDNIGITYLKLHQLDKAIDYCKQSLAISQSTGDKKGEANALLHLAEIYEQANDIQQASKFSNESLAIRKARGDKRGEAEVLLFLADLHKNKNDIDDHQIFEWLSVALNIANEIKAQDILSKAFFNLHEYHQERGDYKKSLAQLESHLQIEKELHKNAINQKVSNLEISHKAEAISQQNKELTELNKQIEKANDELKVESSLERVRTTAMAMKEPDDMLEICKIISHELTLLNAKEIRNVQTAIFYEEKGSYMNYEYYAKHDKTFITDVDYKNHEVAEKFAAQMLKGPNQVWTHGFKGDEIKAWLKYQRTTNVFIDNYLETSDSLNYYWYSLGPVALGISTYSPLSEEQIELFKRFRNVFELAYRRYLDIEKAQLQAREALVEAALEKIRSRSLAMHKSDELKDVVAVLFEKLRELGLDFDGTGIQLFTEGSKDSVLWIRGVILSAPVLVNHPHNEDAFINSEILKDIWQAREKGEPVFNKTYSYEEKNKLVEYTGKHNKGNGTTPEVIEAMLKAAGYTATFIMEKNSGLWIDSWFGKKITVEEFNVAKRVAKVFEQAYIRFLDLKKAEAQARESQIQLALERVRARTMAMQKSDELRQVVAVLFEQIKSLGFEAFMSTIILFDEKDMGYDCLMATNVQSELPDIYHVPYFENRFSQIFAGAFKERVPYKVLPLVGQDKEDYDQYLFSNTDFKKLPEELKQMMLAVKSCQLCCAYMAYGCIEAVGNEPLTEADALILQRFAKVFEQTYTRFLDLQKAEAQAREAQIEAALERVRSRTMGMQKSEELKEVIQLVYEQFVHLNIHIGHTGFILDYKTRDDLHIWLADEHLVPSEVTIPCFDSPPNNSIKEAKEKGKEFFEYLLSFEEKNKFYRDLFKLIPDVPDETVEYYLTCPGLAGSGVLLENIGLYIENFSGTPYTDEENKILMRFGKAFQQTYTRFLDLQKAEAQARESQIQLALERARAQSMMMLHSTELDDTLRVFHEQVLQLRIPSAFSFLWLPDEEEDRHIFWAAWKEKNSFKSKAINYPLDRNEPATAQCLVDWKSNEPVVSYHVPPAGVESYFAAWSELISGVEQLRPEHFSGGLYYVEAFMKYGCFGVMVESSLSEEEKRILARFAIEFERAYTRFLDLQKAEAQAREAQIEAALERVRSRTMAMHKTSELQEVIHTVHKELLNLNLSIDGGSFVVINSDIEEELRCWGSGGTANTSEEVNVPHFNLPFCTNLMEGIKKGPGFFTEEFSQEQKKEYFTKLFDKKPWSDLSNEQKNETLSTLGGYTRSVAVSKYTSIFIINHHGKEFAAAENDILKRFAKVFEQAYTRFLDLQKAEAQAREAQIQLALERVRARTMAMQHSEELGDAAMIMFTQLKELGIKLWAATFDIWKLGDTDAIEYAAGPDGKFIKPFKNPIDYNDPFVKHTLEQLAKGEKLIEITLTGDYLAEAHKKFSTQAQTKEIYDTIVRNGYKFPLLQVHYFAFFSQGFLQFIATEKYTDAHDIFNRMAKVFEQTYTRFLDLQKAEAQAREAQIQLALERVRARTMAMHKSDELSDVAGLLFKQVNDLGVKTWTTGFNVWSDDNNFYTDYITNPEGGFMTPYTIDASSMPVGIKLSQAKKKGDETYVNYEEGEELANTYRKLSEFGEKQFSSILQSGIDFPKQQYEYFVFGVKVSLMFITYEAVSSEAFDVFKRFGKVFQQTYTRFLDLQKAEAQAREAQIEAALERVRSRTMAMHKSSELLETAELLFDQLKLLGADLQGVAFAICDKDSVMVEKWTSIGVFSVPYTIESGEERMYEAWKNQAGIYEEIYEGERIKRYYELFMEIPAFKEGLQKFIEAGYPIPTWQKNHAVTFKHGYLLLITTKPFNDTQIFLRFGKVFEQTYTRFLDLQKAEAQAREAQIEAALERVRAKVMSMTSSKDLDATSLVFGDQLRNLGVDWQFSYFWLIEEDRDDNTFWITWPDNKTSTTTYSLAEADENFRECIVAWKEQTKIHSTHVPVQHVQPWLDTFERITNDAGGMAVEVMKAENFKDGVYYYDAMIKFGSFGILMNRETKDEEKNIQIRFATEFERAYTRFLDLKKAEAQAREAQIEAALERVRSRTLAMQRSDELAETASEVFKQLIGLGIEPNRLYIGIVNADTKNMEMWATDEDGTRVGKKFTFNAADNASVKKLYEGWAAKIKSVTVDMQGTELDDYIDYLKQLRIPLSHALTQKRRVQSVAYFDKGFIGMASPDEQPAENMQLLERFAAVFNLTFTRFNDLKLAEAHALQAEQDLIAIKEAKQKAEEALAELQSTQKQLIQTEKMASLGELTAGIAHEIQNPLNFVNNFSDVSNELIDEMKDELQSGNTEQAIQIINDVKDNLEKILHHGKRADAIVKGMLQHSRSSSGVKEPTDINNLADEYLRLAFHGYRAKDKSFNAKFETHFDNSIEKINVIPQDIGRVILNLINNAFYAVNEKRKQVVNAYEPTVVVSTKKVNDKVVISVKDNGNGIPRKSLDKIFQPFFTTKPTGQGTGLGLSLSYDIITKGHAGEIEVKTDEGKGAEFVISLPVN